MSFAAIEDLPILRATLCVPYVGPWFLDAAIEGEKALPERVTCTIGDLELSGTVDSKHDGTHGGRRVCRVVAGAGAWGRLLARKPYHNDAGVQALTVARDAAREVGEQLGTFEPARPRLGADFARDTCAASRVLEHVAGGVPWWVDFAGVSHVAARETAEADPQTYDVRDFEPLTRKLSLSVDDLSTLVIGTVYSKNLDAPQTAYEYRIEVTPEGLDVFAFCDEPDAHGRGLASTLVRLVRHVMSEKLFGTYRYRVLSMAGDGRVNLQAVRKVDGVPDLLPVESWMTGGVHVKFKRGAEVHVQFEGGDRRYPFLSGGAPRRGVGHVPEAIELAGGERDIACAGDTVTVVFPAIVPFTGTVGGAPATGTLNMAATRAVGSINPGKNRKAKAP